MQLSKSTISNLAPVIQYFEIKTDMNLIPQSHRTLALFTGRRGLSLLPNCHLHLAKSIMADPSRVKSPPVSKLVNMQVLNSSADEFRKLQPAASGHLYDKVVVGAATLRYATDSPSSKMPSILLLKRAPHEPYFPNIFELPSGKVDPNDPTLKYALAREVQEETGLDVTEILAELKPMTYVTEKNVVDDTGREVFVSKSAIQLNYVVSVSGGEVKLNTDEHSESYWATREDLGELDITSEMRAVIQEAFKWAASQ